MLFNLGKKTFFLITGASRGIGQAMAVKVAAKLGEGSVVVLLARNAEGLANTKEQIDVLGKKLQTLTFSIDFSSGATDANLFQATLQKSLQTSGAQASTFDRAIIIHNAGTVGDVSQHARAASDVSEWQQYYQTNLFSAVSLNCEFLRVFAKVPSVVVNITSKCAIEPFASMSYYCSVKAARDMYFRVLAVESEDGNVLVLNYAPGAIDTDMTVLVQRESINKELSAQFKELRETKQMLTTEETTAKFIKVLEAQKFKSGDHVDYWD